MSLPTIPLDKANHVVYGSVIFAVTYVMLMFQQLPALPIAFGVVVAFAVGKEVRDRVTKKGTPDIVDAVATVAGGVVCAIPTLFHH